MPNHAMPALTRIAQYSYNLEGLLRTLWRASPFRPANTFIYRPGALAA